MRDEEVGVLLRLRQLLLCEGARGIDEEDALAAAAALRCVHRGLHSATLQGRVLGENVIAIVY